MSILTRFQSDAVDLAINEQTGEIFVTAQGYAKLSGKSGDTIVKRCKGLGRKTLSIEGCIKTQVKYAGHRIEEFNVIPAATAFKWLEVEKPDLATLMKKSGPSEYLTHLAGYDPKPATAEPASIVRSEDLQRFDRDGIELVIDIRTGEAFATQSGYARMAGLSRQAISKRFKTVNQKGLKTAELETATGLKTVNLIPASLVFKWAMTDNPDLAEAMGAAGATVYIHQLAGFKITSDVIAKPAPEPTPTAAPQLPGDIRLSEMIKSLDRLDIKLLNPRIKQGLQDLALDMLGVRQPALTAENISSREGVWCGVVERAEHLGYSVELILQHRSLLGRFVAKHIGGAVKEDRLCNGTYRPINLYRIGDELDQVIADYFDNL